MQESHVRLRAEKCDVRAKIDAELFQVGAGARMHRKQQRQFRGNLLQRSGNALHVVRAIDVARTVQGHHAVTRMPAFERRGFELGSAHSKLFGLIEHVIDHHVTNIVDRLFRLAFAAQMRHAARLGNEKPVADAVSDQAVDFFGHGQIAAA